MGYWYLAVAILAETIGTSALKASDGFTRLGPGILVVVSYGAAFYYLALALQTIPVGTAYAIWAGMGIVLIALIGALLFREIPDLPAIIGMTLIIAGVAVIQVFSKTLHH